MLTSQHFGSIVNKFGYIKPPAHKRKRIAREGGHRPWAKGERGTQTMCYYRSPNLLPGVRGSNVVKYIK